MQQRIQLRLRRGLTGLIALLLGVTLVASAASSPMTVLQTASDRMIASLKSNKGHLANNMALIQSIVDQNLIPVVDLNRMGALVVGRQYWNGATASQKQQFLSQFTRMVTSTYASALASYNDDVVQFAPLRGNYAASSTVNVQSVIVRKTGQRISVNYNLVNSGGQWKVYDFSIYNISMVQSYNSQFAAVLANGGMDALIQRLNQHNQAVK